MHTYFCKHGKCLWLKVSYKVETEESKRLYKKKNPDLHGRELKEKSCNSELTPSKG